MSTDQQHGKNFEDRLRPGFPGADRCPQETRAAFDFAAEHDPVAHLPTSVKTTGSNTVCLADARRMFNAPTPFRLLVGTYTQKGPIKEVHAIHEFHIQPDEWTRLKGTLPSAEVAAFHDTLLTFVPGKHRAARDWAQARKSALKAHHTGAVQLNPKIDSRSQRRLQASVSLTALMDEVADHTCHQENYRGVALPIALPSTRRERRGKAAASTSADRPESVALEMGGADRIS